MTHAQKKQSLSLIRRLWIDSIKPFRFKILLAFFFMALYSLTTGAVVHLLKPVVNDVFTYKDITQLRWISLAVLLTFIVKGLASYGQGVTLNFIGQSIISQIQKKLFNKIIHSDIQFFMSHKTGTLVSYGTYHITMIRNLISQIITSLGKDSLTLVVLIGVMFSKDAILALIVVLILPFSIFPLSKTGKKMRKISGSTQKETGEWVSYMTQVFQGIRIVKSYNMEEKEERRASTFIDALKIYALKSGRAKAFITPVMETLGGLAIVVIISYGGWQVISGQSTPGDFFSFIAALLMTYEPMKKLANLHTSLQEGLAATEDLFKILDQKSSLPLAKNPIPFALVQGEVVFHDVTFSYGKTPTLKNLSFSLKPKTVTALVGPSGAGKTTVLNLILRFMDPQSGHITLEGHDLKTADLQDLRNQVSLVSQDVVLFHASVRDNILYGNPTATEEEIQTAAKNAAALSFIEELPYGFDTIIGERGEKLSGGQRQRLSLARAFLKDAPILLLDEATSALDADSEKLIQQALFRLSKGKTTLIIAHRLSTVMNANHILVLDQGKLVQEGTHQTLLEQEGLYKNLCSLQFKTNE